jgi:hypothetical protein
MNFFFHIGCFGFDDPNHEFEKLIRVDIFFLKNRL